MYPLIPLPHNMALTHTRAVFPATLSDELFPSAARTLRDLFLRAHNIPLTLSASGSEAILFRSDPAVPDEGYRLDIRESGVTVTAAGKAGAQNAVSTLLQLMAPEDGGFSLPLGRIEDVPACSWRGVMIDLARDFHELDILFEYVDMCRFYKIKYLQLHFTDDQSYTLPSRLFPNLSTKGRCYTEEELRRLIAYAQERGVELIPEIDVPGHCVSFAEGYGDIFGRDGIICLSEGSMAGMRALFGELCELFSDSQYIHVGGDEAAIEKWTTCDRCLSAARARGINTETEDRHALAEVLYATFVREMCDAVLAAGKTPVVWEGFAAEVNHMIPREAVIMSWENYYQTTPSLLEAGFRVVNCSWNPMYIVTPAIHWSLEEVFNWSPYKWRAVHPQSPYLNTELRIPATEQIEGGQLLAWGDQIEKVYPSIAEGVRAEQRLVEERVPALAEGTWHREKPTDFADFSERSAAVSDLYARVCQRR